MWRLNREQARAEAPVWNVLTSNGSRTKEHQLQTAKVITQTQRYSTSGVINRRCRQVGRILGEHYETTQIQPQTHLRWHGVSYAKKRFQPGDRCVPRRTAYGYFHGYNAAESFEKPTFEVFAVKQSCRDGLTVIDPATAKEQRAEAIAKCVVKREGFIMPLAEDLRSDIVGCEYFRFTLSQPWELAEVELTTILCEAAKQSMAEVVLATHLARAPSEWRCVTTGVWRI